ncbi:MAG TPA: DUF1549 domain-containing protein [Pirellulales bacterium]|nr:DUF1549 domain-containing protein [Pirellulales bacterium]
MLLARLNAGCLTWLAVVAIANASNDLEQSDALRLAVEPSQVTLSGRDARFNVLVDGQRADGRTIDLTRESRYRSSSPTVVEVSPEGVLFARNDGAADIEITACGQTAVVHCTVSGTGRPIQYNFAGDIVPLLNRFGCNSSGCHGKAEGQNGFKLSVFGFDPAADYRALAMEDRGRRVFPAAADQSLLLRKASGRAPHGGGIRIDPLSREYRIIREWIADGLRFGDAADPYVIGIALAPRERLLDFRATQQLRVLARYSDGREVDVTSLARFQSNNESLATVDESGLVTAAETPGQVAVMAGFMGQVDLFQALIPRPGPRVKIEQVVESSFIDRHVAAKLEKLNLAPSSPADDATFLRRVYLDTIGTLPTAEEARRFLADTRDDHRQRLVEELLVRPEFADFWALKWSDLLRVDRIALGHKGAYSYYRWIRESLAANKPLDRFARELLTAEGPLAESPPGNFYKVVQKPGDMASTLSQVFLGVRISCAECHHHPYDRWSQSDYYGMVDFFAPLSRRPSAHGEMLIAAAAAETKHPRTGEIVEAHPLGAPTTEPSTGDRRGTLAAWLTSPENPWFARNLANRVWAHFLGRGLVEPVDDMRATNPPSNPELLDALAQHLADHQFDLRALIRAITASRVYQLSSRPNETNERDEQNYSRALLKPLSAEVLLDAVCQTTGVDEKFAGVPEGYRAVQLWDSGVSHYFLKLFGRPVRQTPCECERNTEASVAQVLHFLNSPRIEEKLAHESGRIKRLVAQNADASELVDELYLTFFSRFPEPEERQLGIEHVVGASDRRQAAEDLAWSMLNSLEFVFNH